MLICPVGTKEWAGKVPDAIMALQLEFHFAIGTYVRVIHVFVITLPSPKQANEVEECIKKAPSDVFA
jgi:hypothetical protein